MSFQVLARKWRPKTFADVVGQQQVVRTLENALGAGRVAHAYLFAGVRGTGKTTAARILARALNCTKGETPTAEPCGECDPCREILAGSDMDLFEIDAASHTGVDKVRELIENVRYTPARNRYKVFIIDEVHMLSAAAFNALLKTLEEPPAWAVFILATTEIHKIPATILSRCQQFPFRRLEPKEIDDRIREICSAEGIPFDERSTAALAEAGNGSLRDALSVLDQAITHGGGKLSAAEVESMLGQLDRQFYQELLRSALEGNPAEIVRAVAAVVDAGADPRAAWRDLERYARGLLLVKAAPSMTLPDGLSDGDRSALATLAGAHSYEELLRAYDLILREDGFVRRAEDPRLAFELVLLKVGELGKLRPVEEILREIGGAPSSALPRRAATAAGSAPAPASPSTRDRDEEAPHPPRFTRIAEYRPAPAEDEPPPPPPPPPGSLEALRLRLAAHHPSWGAALAEAQSISVEGGRLRFVWSAEAGAHRDRFTGPTTRADLERLVAEVLGRPLPVDLELAEPPEGDLGQAAANVDRAQLRKNQLTARVYDDPLVQKTIELFRAAVVDVRPDGDSEGEPK